MASPSDGPPPATAAASAASPSPSAHPAASVGCRHLFVAGVVALMCSGSLLLNAGGVAPRRQMGTSADLLAALPGPSPVPPLPQPEVAPALTEVPRLTAAPLAATTSNNDAAGGGSGGSSTPAPTRKPAGKIRRRRGAPDLQEGDAPSLPAERVRRSSKRRAAAGSVSPAEATDEAATTTATATATTVATELIAPARSRDPSQPPRVGVCIVGGVRTLSVTWEHLWANGIEALQPDPARRRVLFETTLTDDCAANRANPQHIIARCRERLAESATYLRSGNVTGHPTRRFDLHVDDGLTNCSHPFAARHQCCKEYPQGMDASSAVAVVGLRQYLRKAQCSARLLQIEKDTGVPFDVVMWIRPDLYLFDQLPSAEQVLRSRYPRVLVSSKEAGQVMGDFIFVAPGPLFVRWHQAIFSAHEGNCRGHKDQIPEERLDSFRRDRNVPIQIYPFLFAITRSNELADCMRLKNEVLSSVSMVDEASGRTTSPFDLCQRRFPQPDPRH